MLKKSPSARSGFYAVTRRCLPLLPCVFSASLSPSACGQEWLPAIEIDAPKPRPAAEKPIAGPAEIGPGNNGQLCTGGVCNDPKSYAAPIQSIGTKLNTPVMDTPVATRTVTRQMLEDQQAVTLDQALRNVGGINTAGGGNAALGNSFTKLNIRGFPTQNYFRDGFRIDSFGAAFAGPGNAELANVENIEVLKGPAAILYGAVEPGGIVNLNIRQPLDHPAYSIQQQIGSYASYRTILDATGPVTADKSLLYRFVGSYENDGSFRQFDYGRNWMVNPTFRWNVDADSWIRLSGQYQRNNLNQDQYFIPYYNNVVPLWLGRSANFGPKSPYAQEQSLTELTWRHDFNKDWAIQQSAFMQLLRNHWQDIGGSTTIQDCITNPLYAGSCFTPSNSVLIDYSSYPSDNRQAEYATAVDLVGHFRTTEALSHALLIGSDYYRYNFRGVSQAPAYAGGVSLLGPPAQLPPLPYGLVPSNATEQYADNLGVYLQDQVSLPHGFNVLAGARYQYINSRTGAADTSVCGLFAYPWTGVPCNFDTIAKRGQSIDRRITPRAALLWRPLEWISFYGSYSESYSPNFNGQLVYGTNQPTPPSAGVQEEAGFKLSLLDDRLQITADYYHLVKTNIPVGIPHNFNAVLLIGAGRSQGPELEIQGELLPGWNVNLAYANIDAITTSSTPFNVNVSPVGSPLPFIPRNTGSLSTSYEFKEGRLKGLKLGARYDYTGYLPFHHYAGDGSYIYGAPTPGYGLVGIFGCYEFNYDGYKITTQLNIDNLFDKSYFTTGGLVPSSFDAFNPNGYGQFFQPLTPGWSTATYNFNVIGAPRTFRGSIKVAF
jgi:iron complex outermembrane recepter protein